MTNSHAIRTTRLTDRQVLDLVQKLKEKMTLDIATVRLISGADVDIKEKNIGDEQMVELYTEGHNIHQAFIVTQDGITISFFRGVRTNLDRPRENRQIPLHFDEIFCEGNNQFRKTDMWRHFVDCIEIVEETLPRAFPIPVQDLDSAHAARQHMHARRELHQRITENIKTRIKEPVVPPTISFLRYIVFFLLTSLGTGAMYMGFDILQAIREITLPAIGRDHDANVVLYQEQVFSHQFEGSILLALGFGLMIYAINWIRLVYINDVRTIRNYERYGNDIARASYAIETIMETSEKGMTKVPDAWVESVCRNLFADEVGGDYGKIPNTASGMLLDLIYEAKLGAEGTEVTMRRRGFRRLSKKLKGGK